MSNLSELKKNVKDHEERISKIEDIIKEKLSGTQIPDEDKTIPHNVRSLLASKIDEVKTPALVVIILKFYGKLSRTKQIQILKELGKKEAESLSGGNYNRDIESKGLVHKVGKSGKDIIYSLTERGKFEADKILRELSKNKK